MYTPPNLQDRNGIINFFAATHNIKEYINYYTDPVAAINLLQFLTPHQLLIYREILFTINPPAKLTTHDVPNALYLTLITSS